jgi:ABC-2 type transport system permease protein
MIICAFIIELLIGFLIGAIAFWTDEVEGMQTTIDRIKRFFFGGYFPLTLLPVSLVTVSKYLPFAYSFFAPAQLYLKKMDLHAGFIGVLIQVGWIVVLSIIVSVVWNRGLKKYEASGS